MFLVDSEQRRVNDLPTANLYIKLTLFQEHFSPSETSLLSTPSTLLEVYFFFTVLCNRHFPFLPYIWLCHPRKTVLFTRSDYDPLALTADGNSN